MADLDRHVAGRWVTAAATGIGSMPGTEIDEACAIAVGEVPGLPFLPELPARGPGSDGLGRSASILVGIPVEVFAGHWQVASRDGRDVRSAREILTGDVLALAAAAHGHPGPIKVQCFGPLTLAAGLRSRTGHPLLADRGARADLAESLAVGLTEHLAVLRAALPGIDVVVQVDEPALRAVLEGSIPNTSGMGRVPAVHVGEARSLLARVLAVDSAPTVVHTCSARPPLALLSEAGATAVAVDVGLLGRHDLDDLAAALDRGVDLWAGVVPSTSARPTDENQMHADAVSTTRLLWRRLGWAPEEAMTRTVVTPTCGLAGASQEHARASLSASRRAAESLRQL